MSRFGRRLKKLGGKLLKAAVTIAPTVVSGGTLTPLSAVAASKLRSVGDNRSRRKLAEKLTSGDGLESYGKALRVTPAKAKRSAVTAPRPRATELVAMRDPAVRALLNTEKAKGKRALVHSRAISARGAKARWAKLDADTKEALQAEFKQQHPKGTQKEWTDFVLANA